MSYNSVPTANNATNDDTLGGSTHSIISTHTVEEVLEFATKKKYEYEVVTDPLQDDKSTEIVLQKFGRPHMRAFHASWISFFMAFVAWFSIAPILPTIKKSLGLTKGQMWASNICAVCATVVMRFIVGPLCDFYGPRRIMAAVLAAGAIPVFLTGTITSFAGLCIVRTFIGIIGSTFVMAQFWTSQMFTKEIVGTANALCGGWGNLGGGVTQLLMGSALFPLFLVLCSGDEDLAWRTVFVVPGVCALVTATCVFLYTDDCPKGNYDELKRKDEIVSHLIGTKKDESTIDSGWASFLNALKDLNTVCLMIQYGACFGVELTMNNAAATYFYEEFGQSQATAAAIASSFGFMNLFARGLGGFLSDYLNKTMSMRGRLIAQFVCIFLEGIFIIIFAVQTELAPAIVCLVAFSVFVQAAEGSSYAIVPYVDPKNKGAVTGAVGAGGNLGAMCWGFIFLFGSSTKNSLLTLAYIVMASSFLTFLIKIPGYGGLVIGQDEPEKVVVADSKFGGEHRNKSLDQLMTEAKEKGVGEHDMVVMEGGPSGKMVKTYSSKTDLEGMVADAGDVELAQVTNTEDGEGAAGMDF